MWQRFASTAASALLLSLPLEAQDSRELLLRLALDYTSTIQCNDFQQETLVHQDGLVIQTTLDDRGVLQLSRAEASVELMVALREVLAANRVGLARGDCGLVVFELNSEHRFALTWFGRSGRRRHLAVAAPGSPECPPATEAIFRAVRQFPAAALQSDAGATTARLQLPPAEGCEPP